MKGQVAIIVLLVSAVMLTMGLSLSKKATVGTKIDTNEELLKKAFNAAESGVNYYLGTGSSSYVSPDGSSGAQVSAGQIGEGLQRLEFGDYIPSGSQEYYWLVDHLTTGELGSDYYVGTSVDVCGVGYTGSAKIDYFYMSGGVHGVRRYWDDDLSSCATITTGGDPLLVVVTPISGGGKFYLQGQAGTSFASQGVDITSMGTAGGIDGATGKDLVNRKVNVRRRYKVPTFLISGVVAEGSVLSD